jgi:predicted NBD/HSP70 family sugar kinase
MNTYIGLDIGGTKFMVAAGDENGMVKQTTKAATPIDFQEGIDLLNSMIAEVTDGEKIFGIGAAIGGPLDWQTGVVSPVHQPQWRNIPLKSMMESRWNCPFHVDVDTNVAALGEYALGKYTERSMLYITLSTGMGGGFIIDGAIYRGMDGAHPEIGHQSVPFRCANPENISCECGAPDCLEALISGNGIRRIYGKPPELLNEEEWAEVTYNLGQGLRNLATIYVPDVIVFGGGIAHGQCEKLLAPARELMESRLKIVPSPRIQLSRHGYDTALMGALYIARQGLR